MEENIEEVTAESGTEPAGPESAAAPAQRPGIAGRKKLVVTSERWKRPWSFESNGRFGIENTSVIFAGAQSSWPTTRLARTSATSCE